jgi:hypothetical protein
LAVAHWAIQQVLKEIMTSQYIIVNYKSIHTGEFVNIAVLSYDTDVSKPEVYLAFVKNWPSVNNAAGLPDDATFENLLSSFLGALSTKETLLKSIDDNQGPALMYGDPQDSEMSADLLATEVAKTLHV